MAAGDKFHKTGQPNLSIEEIRANLLVKTASGVRGTRMVRVSADAADITPVMACGGDGKMDEAKFMNHTIGVTASGKMAVVFIEES